MKITGFPALVVSVVVALVVFGAVIPIFADTTQASDTFTNNGRYYVDTSIDDDVTIVMDYDITTDARTWTIDGETLVYNEIAGAEYVATPTVAGADNWVFRTDGKSRGLNNGTGSSAYTVSVTSAGLSSGALTSNAPIFIASTSETDNVMRYGINSDAYLNGDSSIIACGYTDVLTGENTTAPVVISFTGNIDDGVTFNTPYNKVLSGFTVSNIKINADEVTDHIDLYKFQSVTFDITYNDGTNDYVTPCTYSVVVIPDEVTAERAIHPDATLTAILDMLPFIIGAGLVVGAVAWFITRKG